MNVAVYVHVSTFLIADGHCLYFYRSFLPFLSCSFFGRSNYHPNYRKENGGREASHIGVHEACGAYLVK